MSRIKTHPFDPSEYLDTPEAVVEYLASAFESEDSAVIADAIGQVAKARGMTQLAAETGLARPALYRSLSADGRPELPTLIKVMHALGVRLAPVPIRA